MPNAIPLVAISDTHLGESTSLLCFESGRARLADALRRQLGDSAVVNELVLLGDIPDRALSSTAEVQRDTRALMQLLEKTLRPRRVVYIPGNHDHTLWSGYARLVYGAPARTTSPDGDVLLSRGVPESDPAAGVFLSTFFAPNSRQEYTADFDFVVANPVYVPRLSGRSQTFAFAHGTHFRPDVAAPQPLLKALAQSSLASFTAHLNLRVGGDPLTAPNLAALEAAVAPFVDSLWCNPEDQPISRADELWFVLSLVSGKLSPQRKLTEGTDQVCRFSERGQLGARIADLRAPGLLTGSALGRMRARFLPLLRTFLREHGRAEQPLTLVFGDNHVGGWADFPEERLRVYNTGSWVVHGAGHHPPCHVFVIPQSGEEYLLDVSFTTVRERETSLLELASQDAEHRRSHAEGRFARGTEGLRSWLSSAH